MLVCQGDEGGFFAKRNTTKQLHNRKLDHFSTDFMIFLLCIFRIEIKKRVKNFLFFLLYVLWYWCVIYVC